MEGHPSALLATAGLDDKRLSAVVGVILFGTTLFSKTGAFVDIIAVALLINVQTAISSFVPGVFGFPRDVCNARPEVGNMPAGFKIGIGRLKLLITDPTVATGVFFLGILFGSVRVTAIVLFAVDATTDDDNFVSVAAGNNFVCFTVPAAAATTAPAPAPDRCAKF